MTPHRPRLPDPRRLACAAAAVAALVLALGCEPPAPPRPTGAASSPRIVTLAPALTQMIVDLGHADRLVGVTDKDTAAPPDLPVVGNYVELDSERLVTVRPTHVLQMVAKSGIPTGLSNLAAAAGFEVVGYPYPRSVRDVADTLHGGLGGTRGLGEVLGDPGRAAALRDAMLGFFTDLEALTRDRPAPRVLLVIGTGPLMAEGPGTVHDELLGYAGGTNAAGGASVSAPTYDREALLALNPQVVLLLSPGRKGVDARAMASLLPELQQLPVDAVEQDRLVLINDPATLLPSTSLPRIAAQMARAVHPELAGEIDSLLAGYERATRREAGDADGRQR